MTVVRDRTRPLRATSSTRRATRSQARSLLSRAKLNNAKSRMRCATWSLTRMDQISLALRGGLGPISLPQFQGALVQPEWSATDSFIAVLLKRSPRNNLGRLCRRETQAEHSQRVLVSL